MAIATKRRAILAKVESSYRATTTPTAADDAIEVMEPKWANESLRMIQRPTTKPSLGMKRDIYGGTLRSVTFGVELKGSGTAGTAPDIGVLFRGCGMDETIVGATSVTYAPVSTGQESLTIWLYMDGLLYKMDGCRGTWSLSGNAGEPVRVDFTFTGHILSKSDTALPSPTYDSTVPPTFRGASFSILSYAATISTMSIDIGNSVSIQSDVNDARGFGEVLLLGRDASGSIDPLQTVLATQDWEADLEAGTEGSLSTGVIGSTAGNRWAITCAKAYVRDISDDDRDGASAVGTTLGFAETSGDDEISVAFT